MEMYTNSRAPDRTVFLDFPQVATAIDAFVYRDDELLFEITEVAPVGPAPQIDGYVATLPMHLVQFDADLKIYWKFSYTETDGEEYLINKVTPVTVVTPILSKREVREIDADLFESDFEYEKIEKAVRHIIQAYTGQEFGHFIGTREVKGTGSNTLFLPQRLLEVVEFNGRGIVPGQYVVGSNGHTLRYRPWGVPPVKADAYGLHMHTGGVIHNPNDVRLEKFDSSELFTITGRWGWEDVPGAVREAAKLLVNDYACADSQYRDRYLVSMTAADWRIQFNSGAYMRTGNVRADQLLADYVVTRGWGII